MTKETSNHQREIAFFDLKAQFDSLKGEINEAVSKVFEHCFFVLGPEVKELEKKVAELSGVKHGIGVASGSDALLIALMAIDVRPGDEVITTPFTFFSTAGSIARLGADPVFVDIEPEGYSMDPDGLEEFLDKNYEASEKGAVNRKSGRTAKAIIPIHLFGQLAIMEKINEVAKRYNIIVIEDACQAIAASRVYDNGSPKPAGSWGHIACYSFYPTKNLGGVGDAGMLVTDDEDIAKRSISLRNHGTSGAPYSFAEVGLNSRLDSLLAVPLLIKLKHLDEYNRLRTERAGLYNEIFNDASSNTNGFIQTPVTIEGNVHTYHQYTIRCKERDKLKSHLEKEGINTQIYYATPLHLQDALGYLNYHKGDMPKAESAGEEVLSLPIYPEFPLGDVEYVAARINKFYEGLRPRK